jgi:hypothetical protein
MPGPGTQPAETCTIGITERWELHVATIPTTLEPEREFRSASAIWMSRSHTCRRCGNGAVPRARFCSNCGLRLPGGGLIPNPSFLESMIRGRMLRERGPAWGRLAIRSFRAALDRQPFALEPLLEIARTHRRMGQLVRSRWWYRRSVRRRPDCVEAWLEGASTYPRYDDFHRACWLLQAMRYRPADTAIVSDFNNRFARLGGWHRWWVERALWRVYQLAPVDRVKQTC